MSYDGWVEMPDPDGGEPITLAEIGNYTRGYCNIPGAYLHWWV